MAYEEPRYDIVHKADGYEVRKYYDRVAAQVTKASSSNKAFRTLFGYISGANQTSEKVSMTIPVTQSEKIAMTVAVTQGDSGYMRFFLPASYTLETAPKPTNPDVDVVVVKGGYYAVYSYSGRANDKNFFEARTEPPPLNWSTTMFRKRRTRNGKQATEARRDRYKVTPH